MMTSCFFAPWERKTMIDIVRQMYFSRREKGFFSDTSYFNLPNGTLTLSQLYVLPNWELVRLINLYLDLKIQQYMDGACLNSEERTFAERCAITRRLIHFYRKGVFLADILVEERRKLQQQPPALQGHSDEGRELEPSKKMYKKSKISNKRREKPKFDERRMVTNYCK